MASPASIARHPIHPMLIVLPLGLWIFSLVSDLIYVIGWGGGVWTDVAFYTMAGGLVGALLAAVPGLIDFLALTDPRVKKIGWAHMLINLTVVGSFAVNLWLRTQSAPGATLPLVLSAMAVALLGISGWLGGTMVYVHGTAVESQPETGTPGRQVGRVM
jgi:uncharacterized membrane protein